MQYKSYQHIEKLGRDEVEGILKGKCYIQPKIDGTNSVLYLGDDGIVHAGSRKRDLTLTSDNGGFYNAAIRDERVREYLTRHPDHYIYCEWLIPHSIKYYNDNAWQHFYIFDVLELNEKGGRYLSFDEYVPLLEEYDLPYIPNLAVIEDPTEEQLIEVMKNNHYLVPEDKIGEGIVIKNYDYKNKYGRTTWAKIVAEEFFDTKSKLRMKNHDLKEANWEKKIANIYITEPVVRKEFAKILNEYPEASRQEIIGRVLNAVYNNFIDEDLITAVKVNKNLVLNFSGLKSESNNIVKETIPELFERNWTRAQ